MHPRCFRHPPVRRRPLLAVAALAAAVAAHLAGASPLVAEEEGWRPLFDGKSLAGWEATDFGGQGEVHVEDGALVLEMGDSLTGVTWQEEFPTSGYEIRLEAQRAKGIDFFCGLTFPVNDSHLSFIVGGWAGAVVGLSSLDDKDAARNETTKYMKFEPEQWYRLRVRVEPERVQCWIDDEQVVDADLRERKLSIRPEVELCKPLGLCTWETTGKLRKIEYRELEGRGE